MASKAARVPEGYHTLTPYIIVADAARALEFYKNAFGAIEVMRLPGAAGRIGHAEIRIGDSRVMLADEFPEMDARGPITIGGTPVSLHLYVADADASVERALAAGATLKRPVQDQFYGDRMGGVVDPFGHVWWLATRKEHLSIDELRRRAEALVKQHGG